MKNPESEKYPREYMSSIFLEQRSFPSWFSSQRLINTLLDKAEEELDNPISLFERHLSHLSFLQYRCQLSRVLRHAYLDPNILRVRSVELRYFFVLVAIVLFCF